MTKVVVRTYDLKTGGMIERTLEMNAEGRDWLNRHIVWCANNARGIQIFNPVHERLANELAAVTPER